MSAYVVEENHIEYLVSEMCKPRTGKHLDNYSQNDCLCGRYEQGRSNRRS